MNKKSTAWIIVAAVFIVAGIALFTVVMATNKWEFDKMSTSEFKTNTYDITEDFSDISADLITSDIVLKASEDGTCKVVCYEDEKVKHTVSVQNGTLTIKAIDKREWYNNIGINIETPKVTVYLPKNEYDLYTVNGTTGDVTIPDGFRFERISIVLTTGDVECFADVTEAIDINLSTGDITLENITSAEINATVTTGEIYALNVVCSGNVKTKVSTGKTELINIQCVSMISEGTTGDLLLENVMVSGKISAERSTGDIRIKNSDAAELILTTTTGHIIGSLLSEKVYITKTSTGSIDVPGSANGGKCEVTTSTGDIIFK